MFILKNILIKVNVQLSVAKVNVKMAIPILRNMLLAARFFHLWTDFDITSYNCRFGNILDKFLFQHDRAKVKVTVAVRRKLCSLFWPSHLKPDFNITSHKCLV